MAPPDDGSQSTVRVVVPADASALSLLRTTAAAAAANHARTLEQLDDVRLAVGELAAELVRSAVPGRRLTVDIDVAPGHVAVRGRARGNGRTPALSSVGRMLVSSVSHDHSLHRDGDDLVFTLVVDVGNGDD